MLVGDATSIAFLMKKNTNVEKVRELYKNI